MFAATPQTGGSLCSRLVANAFRPTARVTLVNTTADPVPGIDPTS